MQVQELDLPGLSGEYGGCPPNEQIESHRRRDPNKISIETIIETDLDNPTAPSNSRDEKARPDSSTLPSYQTQGLEPSRGSGHAQDQLTNGDNELYSELFCTLPRHFSFDFTSRPSLSQTSWFARIKGIFAGIITGKTSASGTTNTTNEPEEGQADRSQQVIELKPVTRDPNTTSTPPDEARAYLAKPALGVRKWETVSVIDISPDHVPSLPPAIADHQVVEGLDQGGDRVQVLHRCRTVREGLYLKAKSSEVLLGASVKRL